MGGSTAGRRHQGESTRAVLLDAARRLWAERGIQGASLHDVATAAGLTKGAVYSNFTGKADLLLALLEDQTSGAERVLGGFSHTGRQPDGHANDGGCGLTDLTDLTDQTDRTGSAGELPGMPVPASGGLVQQLADADDEQETDALRLLTLLLIELWLYGMRDYSAGWRIADWYHSIRTDLARTLADRPDLADRPGLDGSPEELATVAVAVDLGLALQHLLDPARVPASVCAAGLRRVLGYCAADGAGPEGTMSGAPRR